MRGAVFQQRYRGAHVLQRDENGLEKCVACFLCAAACPANCIFIEAAENTEENRISSSSATPKSTTSTTTAASSAAIALKPAHGRHYHGHGFELATSTPPISLCARKTC